MLGSVTPPVVEHLVRFDAALRMVPVDTEALRSVVGQLRAAKPASVRERGVVARRLGLALIALGDFVQAIEALERAVTIAVQVDDVRAQIAARINLGDAFRYAGCVKPGAAQYTRALDLAREQASDLVDSLCSTSANITSRPASRTSLAPV